MESRILQETCLLHRSILVAPEKEDWKIISSYRVLRFHGKEQQFRTADVVSDAHRYVLALVVFGKIWGVLALDEYHISIQRFLIRSPSHDCVVRTNANKPV